LLVDDGLASSLVEALVGRLSMLLLAISAKAGALILPNAQKSRPSFSTDGLRWILLGLEKRPLSFFYALFAVLFLSPARYSAELL
jgi:hypothetical protein